MHGVALGKSVRKAQSTNMWATDILSANCSLAEKGHHTHASLGLPIHLVLGRAGASLPSAVL